MKKFKILIIISIIFITSVALAYDNYETHPKLTLAAIDIFNEQADKKLSASDAELISQGSTEEDVNPRYLNHYYNPETGQGLADTSEVPDLLKNLPIHSAKEWLWAQDSATGDFSVPAILNYYRAGNTADAHKGVGHILHLLQDMTVPAHTRDDTHKNGDIFELWAKANGVINRSKIDYIQVDDLNTIADELATYSHNNFISYDRADTSQFSSNRIIKGTMNGKNIGYLMNNINGIDYRIAFTFSPDSINPDFVFIDDTKLNIDYWNMLYPKAVGASAGAIGYFEREFAKIDEEKKQKQELSLWQKIVSPFSNFKNDLKSTSLAMWNSFDINASDFILNTIPEKTKLAEQNIDYFVEANKEIAQSAANRAAVLGEKAVEEIIKPITKLKPVIKITNPRVLKQGVPSPQKTSPQPSPYKGEGENGGEGRENPLLGKEGWPEAGVVNPIPNLGFMMLAGPPPALAAEEIIIPADTLAPTINIISGVFMFSNSSTSEFILQSNESPVDFSCNVDDLAWQACAATTTIEYLSEGQHVLAVKAVDAAGNTSAIASTTWLVDLTAPTVDFVPLDAEYASSSIPVYWMGEDKVASSTEVSGMATFDLEYRINADDWQTWFSGIIATSSIFDKTATSGDELFFRVRARDRAGNVSAWQGVQTKIAAAEPDKVVISEIYGGGGNSGATYKNDFIELYNPTGHDISLDGWSIQYASASGAFGSNITVLSGVILSKSHYLIQEKAGSGGTQDLPAPAAAGNINLAATAGKVALVKDNEAITNRFAISVIDFVGYGTASEFEGAGSALAPSNKASISRDANHTDSDSNDTDFIVLDPPQPENASGAMPLVPPVCRTIPIDADYNITIDTLTAGHDPYCVPSGDPIQIPAGQIVNIEPGTIIKFEADAYMTIYGELNALGTADKKITFTSIYDNRLTPGQVVPPFTDYWFGMYIAPGGRLDLDHAQVHYVGRAGWLVSAKPKKVRTNVRLAIIMVPTYPAIAVRDGEVVINHSEISHNSVGFQAYGASTVEISNTSLINNTEGGLFNNGSNFISAINNWWGDASGPYDYINNAAGLGQQIGGKINYTPWLLSQPD